MPIITRLTHEFAMRMLSPKHYLVNGPASPDLSSEGRVPVYLSFDDGPHPERTPPILEQLAEMGAHATFFVCGKQAHSHPQLLRRIRTEGHSVGNHSWSHPSLQDLSHSQWTEDVQRGQRQLEDTLGEACKLFRPPYGELTPRALRFLLAESQKVVMWSLDTKDYETPSPEHFRGWFDDNAPAAGCIVLMHDGTQITSEHLRSACTVWQEQADFLPLPMHP